MGSTIQRFSVLPALVNHVKNIFLIESPSHAFDYSVNQVEPNGTCKLTVCLDNNISSRSKYRKFVAKEGQVILSGIFDCPFEIQGFKDQHTRLLVIELAAGAAYRMLKMSQIDHVNSFCPWADIYGRLATELEGMMGEEPKISRKVALFQRFLQGLLDDAPVDLVFDHCIKRIESSDGTISVKELEKSTGFSSRWLNMKFKQRLGVSPKLYASIMRFQALLTHVAALKETKESEKAYLNYCYDQSHYIKEFKRYAGVTPHEFLARN